MGMGWEITPSLKERDLSTSHVYNQDGTIRNATIAKVPGAKTSDVTKLSPIHDSLIPPTEALGASKVPRGQINWLGSSYSGADIKVVAHLYTTIESPETKQREKAIEDLYADSLERLLNGGVQRFKNSITNNPNVTTWEDLKKTWLDIAQANAISDSDVTIFQEVERRLVRQLRRFLNLVSPNSARVFQAQLISKAQDARAYADNLAGIIEAWKQLEYSASATEIIATIQTLSVQTHREKFGVRALGRSSVKGYTRGPRTIAGSMVMTVFNEHALARLIKAIGNPARIGESKLDTNISSLIPDQLPPLDLTVIFANEYGSISRMGIYGVEFVNDGQTMSIEDLMTEEVMNFVARDIDIMTSVGRRKLSQLERGVWTTEEGKPLEGSELLRKIMFGGGHAYREYLKRLGVRRSLRGR